MKSKNRSLSNDFFKEVSSGFGSKMRERIALLEESRRQNAAIRTSYLPADSENVSFQQMEQRAQIHMEAEDKRVSEVAEGILYDFLPAAFNAIIPPCTNPRTELTFERCKLVASAALSVGALLNCPPTLLEVLLRIPWQKIEELLRKTEDHEWIAQQLDISEETRRELVNISIHPKLMPSVIDFIFSESFLSSGPIQFRPISDMDRPQQLEKIAALLDGACPLHCAAIRGNPAQVGHFLSCGADPLIKTATGDLPIEMVPFCGDRTSQTNKRICRCMSIKEQEIWECRSSNARTLIARNCILTTKNGLFAWFTMLLLCILSWFGFWGCHAHVCHRPQVLKHVEYLRKAKSDKARFECKELLSELRKEVRKGHQLLALAKQQNPIPKKMTNREENVAENAFICFMHAIQYLQSLEAKNEGKESVYTFTAGVPNTFYPTQTTSSLSAMTVQYPDCQLPEDEKADVYCSWAESVLFKFKFCRCAGCASLAVQSMRMAHVQCAQLLEFIKKQHQQHQSEEFPEKQNSIGRDLMKIVYFHICLLLETETSVSSSCKKHQSATKASLWRAEQCLKEWRYLRDQGYHSAIPLSEEKEIYELDEWVETAESDLLLAEAMYGDELTPSQTIEEVLGLTVIESSSGLQYLAKTSALDNIAKIEEVLKHVKSPSLDLADLTQEVMENGKKEMKAAAILKESLSSKPTPGVLSTIKKLSDAIREAVSFPRLSEQVAEAKKLQQQLHKRGEAIEKLDRVMVEAREPLTSNDNKEKSTISANIAQRVKDLQEGINHGKLAKINTEKAKRLLRDLQAQLSAVEATHQLDGVMEKRPCGYVALRTALSKAENSYALASGSAVSTGLLSMSEVLLPAIQAARKRLDVEKGVEALNRATSHYTRVEDLSKLESHILNARKVGAEELDPAGYHAARALRGALDNAAKLKQQLENGTSLLKKHQRESDALMLEETIQRALDSWHLIEEDGKKAQEAIEHWQKIQEVEENLQQVTRCCRSSSELAKVLQEATSVGAKSQSGKKTLKLIQNLENAIQQIDVSPEKCDRLCSYLEEAENGLIGQKLTAIGRFIYEGMRAVHAREKLESVLFQPNTFKLNEWCSKLRNGLEQARSIVDWHLWQDDREKLLKSQFDEDWKERMENDGPWVVMHQRKVVENRKRLVEMARKAEMELSEKENEICRLKQKELERLKMEQEEKRKKEQEEKQLAEQKRKKEADLKPKEPQIDYNNRKIKKLIFAVNTAEPKSKKQNIEKQDSASSVLIRSTSLTPPTGRNPKSETLLTVDEKESLAVLEHGVESILEQESSQFSPSGFSSSNEEASMNTNLYAKGVLETLKDPWGVEGTTQSHIFNPSPTPLPPPPPPQSHYPHSLVISSTPCSIPLRNEHGNGQIKVPRSFQEMFPHACFPPGLAGNGLSQLYDKNPTTTFAERRSNCFVEKTGSTSAPNTRSQMLYIPNSRCGETILGSSAFSNPKVTQQQPPTAPFFQTLTSAPMPLVRNASWNLDHCSSGSIRPDYRSGDCIPAYQERALSPEASPFPGVGIGIPGTPNRSLSERIGKYLPSDYQLYSRSADLMSFAAFDSKKYNLFGSTDGSSSNTNGQS